MSDEDKKLIKRLYDLTDTEVFEAEKLFHRSSFSICGAARAVVRRRKPTK